MDNRDREAIEELFQKIVEVERRSGPRDPEAEAFIRAKIAQHPAAPYLMAQTIVVQDEALNEAERRIADLESRAGQGQGGLLGGLFGGGAPQRSRRYAAPVSRDDQGPWGGRGRGAGGGFLAGAAQTAMGVAGGVLLGNMIADLFSPDAAAAGEAGDAGLEDTGAEADAEADVGGADAGGDFGGDFDLGSF